MKKNFFGLLAIVLAIGFSAFSTRQTPVYFEYIAPSGSYLQADVQTESNWTKVSEANRPCVTNLVEKACVIGIPPAEVPFPAQTLLSNAAPSLSVIAQSQTIAGVTDVTKSGVTIAPSKLNDEE